MTNDTTLTTLGGARVDAVLRYSEHAEYGLVADVLLAGYPLGAAVIYDYPLDGLTITRTADVDAEVAA